MLEKTTIARPYAEAAFAQAQEDGAVSAWADLLGKLSQTVSDSRMETLIHNPRVSAEQLLDIVQTVVGELGKTQQNFVKLLIANRRLQYAPQMFSLFEQQQLESEGRARVQVLSAFPLEDSQRDGIASAMSKRLGKKVDVSSSTDESLIGGAIIRHGDAVIDASIRGQLEELRSQLA